MSALEFALIVLHWSFFGIIYIGVAFIVAVIFGNIARYGSREDDDR